MWNPSQGEDLAASTLPAPWVTSLVAKNKLHLKMAGSLQFTPVHTSHHPSFSALPQLMVQTRPTPCYSSERNDHIETTPAARAAPAISVHVEARHGCASAQPPGTTPASCHDGKAALTGARQVHGSLTDEHDLLTAIFSHP